METKPFKNVRNITPWVTLGNANPNERSNMLTMGHDEYHNVFRYY